MMFPEFVFYRMTCLPDATGGLIPDFWNHFQIRFNKPTENWNLPYKIWYETAEDFSAQNYKFEPFLKHMDVFRRSWFQVTDWSL
jgi:hypothetical protein